MVRKGNQHKSSLDRKTANGRHRVSDPADVSLSEQKEKSKVHDQHTVAGELSGDGNFCRSSSTSGERLNETNYTGSGKRNKQRHHNIPCREKSDVATPDSAATEESVNYVRNAAEDDMLLNATEPRRNDVLFGSNHNPSLNMSAGLSMETMAGHIRSSAAVACQKLRLVGLDVFSAAKKWHEQQKPRLSILKAHMCSGRDYILVQIKHVYPVIWTWILHFGQLIFLLSVAWLDCNIRGLSSLMCLGTTSFFTIVWCSILSIIAMVGFTKALIVMVGVTASPFIQIILILDKEL